VQTNEQKGGSNMLMKKMAFPLLIIMCFTLVLMGCSASKQGQNQGKDQANKEQEALMRELNALLENKAATSQIITFVDNNIAKLSPENASQVVLKMEKAQQNYLPEFETKFYDEAITKKFYDAYFKTGTDINDIDAIEDPELKQLLLQSRDAGYKVDTAEGMFYPIIDYQQYQDYKAFVTPDIKAYIDIMTVESNNPPAKDAALVIGWDEVLTRALNQEKFINTYADSARLADVQKLYERYVQFCLLGANNTPLFSYEDKTMSSEAKSSYAKVLAESKASELTKIMQGLLDVVAQNNNQLTAAVDNYRKKCFEELDINQTFM